MPKLYRIRFIPFETIDISSDALLYRDNAHIVTQWYPINPRPDISSGISCVFLKEGWKISAIMDESNTVQYWYCDIIDIDYDEKEDVYRFYDLLTDIKIDRDGRIEVLDLDELAIAYEQSLITQDRLLKSLKQSYNLLKFLYATDVSVYMSDFLKKLTGRECINL